MSWFIIQVYAEIKRVCKSNNAFLDEEIVNGIVKKVRGNMRLGLLLAQAAAGYRFREF